MRLFVVCAVATSLMGCSVVAAVHHRTARPEPSCGWLAAGGAADVAAVGVLAGVLGPSLAHQPSDAELAAALFGLPTLFYLGVDAIDAAVSCHRERDRRESQLAIRAREDAVKQQTIEAREQAWKLTVEAETAARSGDCARVAELDPQIAAIDTGVHDVVFARDLGVIRCRGSAL